MQTAQFALHAELEDRHWWFRGRRAIVRRLVHRAFPPADGRAIVDVGCGTGANLADFAGPYGIDVIVENHGSHGSFVNGRRVAGATPVARGDRLSVGTPGVELHFITVTDDDAAPRD